MLTIWIICATLCLIVFVQEGKVYFICGHKSVPLRTLFAVIIFFLLVILMTANNAGYDADAFIRFFNFVKEFGLNPYDYTYDMLFNVEQFTLRFLPTLTYQQFHALILFIVGAFCIYPFLKNYSLDPAAVLSLYVLSGVFASDGMQFKNFIAASLLILSFCFYCDDEHKNSNLIAYYFILIIAITFHFSFVIYIFLPLARIWFSKASKLFPVVGGILYFVFLFWGNFFGSALSYFLKIQFLSKAEGYVDARTGVRSLVPFAIYYIVLAALYYITNWNTELQTEKMDKKSRNIESLAINVQIVWETMGLFLVILCFANASYRLFRNLYIPIFTVIINSIQSIKSRNRRRMAIIITIGVALLIFIYPILLGQQVDIYDPIIEGKWFWSSRMDI